MLDRATTGASGDKPSACESTFDLISSLFRIWRTVPENKQFCQMSAGALSPLEIWEKLDRCEDFSLCILSGVRYGCVQKEVVGR